MPSPYGLGYGMGAIGAGLAQGQLAATMMKPGLQHQQMQNQMLQQQIKDREGLGLAAQNAWDVDPATGEKTFNQQKFLAGIGQYSPGNFVPATTTFANQNYKNAMIEKAGSQTENIDAKTKALQDEQHKKKIETTLNVLYNLPKDLQKDYLIHNVPELDEQLKKTYGEDFHERPDLQEIIKNIAKGYNVPLWKLQQTEQQKELFEEEEKGKMARSIHPGIGPDGKTGYFQLNEKGEIPPGWKPIPPSSTVIQMPQGVSPSVKEGKTGLDVLGTIPPGPRGVVWAIVEGRQSPPSGFAQKTPYWQGIMQNVYAIDPQWNEQRAQIRKSFATGPEGKNIGALNTASVHLDNYLMAAEALRNGTFRPGNALYNHVRTMLGKSGPITFETIKNAVAGEQANALKGNATDIEIRNISNALSESNSPEQFVEAGKMALNVMRQKLQTYRERYQQVNPGDEVWSPVLPSAHSVYRKYGIGEEMGAQQMTIHQPKVTPTVGPKETPKSNKAADLW